MVPTKTCIEEGQDALSLDMVLLFASGSTKTGHIRTHMHALFLYLLMQIMNYVCSIHKPKEITNPLL